MPPWRCGLHAIGIDFVRKVGLYGGGSALTRVERGTIGMVGTFGLAVTIWGGDVENHRAP